jgi:hypothetical protein
VFAGLDRMLSGPDPLPRPGPMVEKLSMKDMMVFQSFETSNHHPLYYIERRTNECSRDCDTERTNFFHQGTTQRSRWLLRPLA